MKKYKLFLDESGHHGLRTINQDFPILLLCGCILEEGYYWGEFSDEFNTIKEKYFGTTKIVFHSRDIRKWQNEFQVLGDPKLRNNFYKDINQLVAGANFTVIAAAILKNELIKEYGPRADNPYDLCLAFILERTVFYLDTMNCDKVEIIAEARGKKEDSALQNQFQLILSHGTKYVEPSRFQEKFTSLDFVRKEENVLGTQLCDLVAYPVATKVLYPERENFAFEIVEPKIYTHFPGGDYLGYGLKVFP